MGSLCCIDWVPPSVAISGDAGGGEDLIVLVLIVLVVTVFGLAIWRSR